MENSKLEELRAKLADIQNEETKNEYAKKINIAEGERQELENEKDLGTRDVYKKAEKQKEIEQKEAEIADLKAKKEEQENAKKELASEVKQEQEKIQQEIAKRKQKIEDLKKKNEKLQNDVNELSEEISEDEEFVQRKIIKGRKSSGAYTSTMEELQTLIKRQEGKVGNIKKNNKRIQKLEGEITGLEDIYTQFDEIFAEALGRKKDEPEQRKNDNVEPDIPGQGKGDSLEPDIPEQGEKSEPATQEKGEGEKPEPATQEQGGRGNPVPHTQGQGPNHIPPQRGVNNPTREANQNPLAEQVKDNEQSGEWLEDISNCKVAKVEFYILNGTEPCYKISFANEKGEFVGSRSYEGYDKLQLATKEAVKDYPAKNSEKYYDFGLSQILIQLDEETGERDKYGISADRRYYKMLISRNQEIGDSEKEKIDINYDFSNLDKYPNDIEQKAKLKALQKIVKLSSKTKNPINTYQKAPNLLQRLWKKLTSKQKALPVQEEQKMPETSTQQPEVQEPIQELKTPEQNIKKSIHEVWLDLHTEPGFDIKEFISSYNLSEEEADTYKFKQSQYERRIEFARKFDAKKKEMGKGAAIEGIVEEELSQVQQPKEEEQEIGE